MPIVGRKGGAVYVHIDYTISGHTKGSEPRNPTDFVTQTLYLCGHLWSISTIVTGIYKSYFFMKRKQKATDDDLYKPTYTHEHLPTQHNTHQPNPQPRSQVGPKQLKTVYQASTEFLFRSSLGFLVFDEERKSKLHGESKQFTFSFFSLLFQFTFTRVSV